MLARVGMLVIVCVVLGPGCKKSGAVIGSCDRRAKDKRESVCSDAFVDAPILSTCDTEYGFEVIGTKSASPCDRTGALAGCKQAAGTKWWFPTKTVRTVENVAFLCEGTLVGTDGAALGGVTKTRLPTYAEVDAMELVPNAKAAIDPMLATVERIAAKLPPPSTKFIAPAEYVKRPTLYAYAEDLAALGGTASVAHRVPSTLVLPACARLVRKMDSTDVKDVAATLRTCAEAKALAVVRIAAIEEPKVAKGDVLVFDLSNEALIGVAQFSTSGSKDIGDAGDDVVRMDFDTQIATAVDFAAFAATGQKLTSVGY